LILPELLSFRIFTLFSLTFTRNLLHFPDYSEMNGQIEEVAAVISAVEDVAAVEAVAIEPAAKPKPAKQPRIYKIDYKSSPPEISNLTIFGLQGTGKSLLVKIATLLLIGLGKKVVPRDTSVLNCSAPNGDYIIIAAGLTQKAVDKMTKQKARVVYLFGLKDDEKGPRDKMYQVSGFLNKRLENRPQSDVAPTMSIEERKKLPPTADSFGVSVDMVEKSFELAKLGFVHRICEDSKDIVEFLKLYFGIDVSTKIVDAIIGSSELKDLYIKLASHNKLKEFEPYYKKLCSEICDALKALDCKAPADSADSANSADSASAGP
jgi:hypothetical protein